jgi:Flp pilus assembly protein TadG
VMRRSLRQLISLYLKDASGAAAVEFVIWMVALTPILLNVTDLSIYLSRGTQVGNAAQVAAQAAWAHCSTPPTSSCTNFDTYIANAISNGSSLRTAVTEPSGQRAEGYYCPDPVTKALVSNGGSSTCPSGEKAGYYFKLRVSYTYTPVFPAISIISLLPNPILRDAWIRLT